MSRRVIAERHVGLRVVAGTEWSVDDYVIRDQRTGRRPTWIVERARCNGVPLAAQEYATKREALAAFSAAGEGVAS